MPSLQGIGAIAFEKTGGRNPPSNLVVKRWLAEAGVAVRDRTTVNRLLIPGDTRRANIALGRAAQRRKMPPDETRPCENPGCGKQITRRGWGFRAHAYCSRRCWAYGHWAVLKSSGR